MVVEPPMKIIHSAVLRRDVLFNEVRLLPGSIIMSVRMQGGDIRLSILQDMEGRATDRKTFVIADEQHPIPDLKDHRLEYIGSVEVEDDYVGMKTLHVFEYAFQWEGSEDERRAMDQFRGDMQGP
jgi:hypothetical protein